MLSGLLRIGDLDNAGKLFDEMPVKDVVSWSALIGGYVQCGMSKQALGVFREMQVANVKPNDVTLVNVLAACAHLGALEQGKWVHGYLKSNRVELSVFLGSSLIDMYTKCGEVELALEVFNGMIIIPFVVNWPKTTNVFISVSYFSWLSGKPKVVRFCRIQKKIDWKRVSAVDSTSIYQHCHRLLSTASNFSLVPVDALALPVHVQTVKALSPCSLLQYALHTFAGKISITAATEEKKQLE
ncbi:Pentatricopeptide repeat [Dillenia turbinata]|uniref:Pentatricopeptide repeat n=1 Tax=Dillenia turbinata TaxID=194707 RepID=A0AAN8UUM7_9MAGN